jgi:hypothetical protein
MKVKLDNVRELGAAAAEEWYNGLEADGKEKAANTARWEQWELVGGFQAITYTMSQLRNSQRPNQEPHHRNDTYMATQNTSCFGMATKTEFPVNRPLNNSQAYSWTTIGMRSIF